MKAFKKRPSIVRVNLNILLAIFFFLNIQRKFNSSTYSHAGNLTCFPPLCARAAFHTITHAIHRLLLTYVLSFISNCDPVESENLSTDKRSPLAELDGMYIHHIYLGIFQLKTSVIEYVSLFACSR